MEWKSVSAFVQGEDADRRRMRVSRSSRLLLLLLLLRLWRRRGIYRRKFPVAKIHDLYIGIGHQRLNGLIAFRRRDCMVEAFVSDNLRARCIGYGERRLHNATYSVGLHNLSFWGGMRNSNALQSDAPVNQQFVDVTYGSGTKPVPVLYRSQRDGGFVDNLNDSTTILWWNWMLVYSVIIWKLFLSITSQTSWLLTGRVAGDRLSTNRLLCWLHVTDFLLHLTDNLTNTKSLSVSSCGRKPSVPPLGL